MTTTTTAHLSAASRARLPRFEDRLALGKTLRVSPFCLGIVRDPRTVPAAFDAGINFFFLTADMHWPLYEPLRRGLAMLLERKNGIRERIAVAIVSYVTQPEFCFAPFEEAVASVAGLGRADVTVMGGSYATDFFVRHGQYRTHADGTIEGGAAATGASFHDRAAAANAVSSGLVDLAFCRYSPAHPGAEHDLLPHVRARRGLLYNFKSTTGSASAERLTTLGLPADKWRPMVTDYYRFVLTRPEIDGVLCAPQTPAEVRGIADAMERGALDAQECRYMKDLAELTFGRATLA